ncbi:hypothetical protein B0H13DRAFT_2344319 [Mycena leptocephala]|nr:hypothetical protein B0H13DRAFT_2363853 [Mycena leptocephala]KAJ7883131.1 hypothetical protein B0H13DRAFT_2344319 [Mycena leptocephala]
MRTHRDQIGTTRLPRPAPVHVVLIGAATGLQAHPVQFQSPLLAARAGQARCGSPAAPHLPPTPYSVGRTLMCIWCNYDGNILPPTPTAGDLISRSPRLVLPLTLPFFAQGHPSWFFYWSRSSVVISRRIGYRAYRLYPACILSIPPPFCWASVGTPFYDRSSLTPPAAIDFTPS